MQTQQTWDLEDVKEELKALIRIPSVSVGKKYAEKLPPLRL